MPARLLAEWAAYAELEPFGSPADWTQAAMITSKIHNVNCTKESQCTKPFDYLPNAMVQEPPMDDEELGERNASILKQISEERRGQ